MTRMLWLLPLFGLLLPQNAGATTPEKAPTPADVQEIVALLGVQSSPALPPSLDLVPRPTNRVTCFPEPICHVDSDCAEFCGGWIPHCTWIRCPNRILACVCTEP